MDSRQCGFMPPDAPRQICHSALPRTPNQSSNLYYEPLNRTKSEIRVLCPYTPTGSSIDKLEFTIRTVSLNHKPKYWALSYVWGDPNETEPICIEGRTFMVTRNLREALKRARIMMTVETIDLQLWIDAICINQADTTEKSWQVAMMARIYKESYCVDVWLGLADHNAAIAMNFVASIGASKFTGDSPLADEQFTAICVDSINRCQKDHEIENLELITALEDIFHHRQYWKRAWTLQEFCSSTSVIWCGDSFISLGSAINFVLRSRDIARRAKIAGPGFCNMTPTVAEFIQCIRDVGEALIERLNAGAIEREHHQYGKYSEEEKLGILLCQATGRQASEPKDKIYSLVGLCKVKITPDYSDSLSAGQLYQDTSALILKKTKDTDLLTMLLSFGGLSNQSQSRCVPSWTVEWDMVAKAPVNFKAPTMSSNKTFITREPPLCFSDLEICFQGIIIDQIEEAYVPPFKHNLKPEGIRILEFFFSYPQMNILPYVLKHQPKYRTGISLFTAVLSTLLLGRDVLSTNDYDRLFVHNASRESFRKVARVFLSILHHSWNSTGPFKISTETRLALVRSYVGSSDQIQLGNRKDLIDKAIDKIFGFEKGLLTGDEIYYACSASLEPADGYSFHNKTPFGAHANQMAALKTKEGYIGAGRAGIAPHDVICVLRDATIPFILRPVGEKFVLVSPCYIEGLMDGEAWEMVQAGEKSVRTIKVI